MEIIDKNGYLDSAFNFIKKNIISGKILKKLAEKEKFNKKDLKNLISCAKEISFKDLLISVNEKLEQMHTSLMGATAEIKGVDVSIGKQKKKLFILLDLSFKIMVDNDKKDEGNFSLKIFSKNHIE